jgi:hypothetical protein
MLELLLLLSCLSITLIIVVLVITQTNDSVSGTSGSSSSSGGPLVDMGTEIKALNASGKVPPTVMKEGKKAFEVVLKKDMIHGEGSNVSMTMKPKQFFPSTSCRVRYKLWFDDSFDWKQTNSYTVGGKLGGFRIGSGPSTGGNYSDEGASFRLIFKPDRAAAGYFYPQLKSDRSGGNPSWSELDQDQTLENQSYIATGVHVWYINHKPQLFFKSNAWNDIEMFVKLNTPGKKDGIMELVVNGVPKRLTNVRYRNTDIKIERYYLEVFFGGGNDSYAPRTDVRLWFADFAFGTS